MRITAFQTAIVVLFGLIATVCNGDESRLSVGPFGGVNVARVAPGTDVTGANARRSGLALGINAELNLGHGFFLRPEVGYIQKGDAQISNSVTTTEHLDYLEHSILIKAKAGPPNFRVFVEAGPSLGYAVARYSDTSDNSVARTELDSVVATTDLSVLFGFGAEFKMEEDYHFIITGRYLYGFSDLRAGTTTSANSIPVNNRGILILAGINVFL